MYRPLPPYPSGSAYSRWTRAWRVPACKALKCKHPYAQGAQGAGLQRGVMIRPKQPRAEA